MKPFDLEAAKRGEPICTREGQPVKFIVHVPEAQETYKVIVLHEDGLTSAHGDDGSYYEDCESGFDLFMAAKKRTVWVNVYKNGLPPIGAVYSTQDDADKRDASDRIGNRAWPLEIEE